MAKDFTPKNEKIHSIELTDFSGGLNTRQDPQFIADNESPDMLNVNVTDEGALVTRFGYEEVCTLPAGTRTYGLLPFYKLSATAFNRLCIFGNDGHLYYITGSSNTPVDAGSYLTATGMTATDTVRGKVLNDLLILGNGTEKPVKYDGTTIAAIGTYALAAKTSIFENFGGTGGATGSGTKMYAAGATAALTTLYNSNAGNPDNWDGAGDAGATPVATLDGNKITGIKAIDDNLFVFKRDNTYIGKLYLDSSFNITSIRITPNKLAAGCVAPDSISIFGNDIIRLCDPQTYGVQSLGFQESYLTQNQRNGSLSWKIQPSIRNINPAAMGKACGAFYQDRYYLSVPNGISTENDTQYVFSYTLEGKGYWTKYNDIPAESLTTFRNDAGKTELYFGSNLEPTVFKFNTSFSDDNTGYTRYWRSKTFTLGARTLLKDFLTFYIRGAISLGTTLKFRVVVDGTPFEYTIDKTYLDENTGGSLIGDDIYGDALFGGAEGSGMYRFMYRDNFPLQIRKGRQIYFELENNGIGQGWKVDYIKLDYQFEPDANYPMTLTSN